MIDAKLQAELRAKFNPDGSPLRQLQLRQLEILKYVDAFCKKNDITYWLSSGTCLGAVRHGGFIPWDDDIDIEMLRKDYLRFLKLWKDTGNYTIQNRHNEKYFIFSFSKIRESNTYFEEDGVARHYMKQGIFIDIFCMERFMKFPALVGDFFLRRIGNLIRIPNPTRLRRVLFVIGKKCLFACGAILRPIMRCIPMSNGSIRHAFGSCNARNTRYLHEIFPLRSISFEGVSLPVPGNYHSYLTHMFGNYNKIPDIDSPQFHTHAKSFSLSKAQV